MAPVRSVDPSCRLLLFPVGGMGGVLRSCLEPPSGHRRAAPTRGGPRGPPSSSIYPSVHVTTLPTPADLTPRPPAGVAVWGLLEMLLLVFGVRAKLLVGHLPRGLCVRAQVPLLLSPPSSPIRGPVPAGPPTGSLS